MKLKITPFVPSELNEQEVVFAWAKLNEPRWPELRLLHSTLNGIRLPIGLAVKAKRAGNKPGCPDIYLDVARNDYHGLRCELKRRAGGRLSPSQQWWTEYLRGQGYYVVVAHGASDAIRAIKDYLEIEPA